MHAASNTLVACVSNPVSIEIPAEIEVIGERCFMDREVANVTFAIGSRLKRIEEGAFAGCPMLYQIWFPPSVETIGDDCFTGSSLQTAIFETPVPAHDIQISPTTFHDGVRMYGLDEEGIEEEDMDEEEEDMDEEEEDMDLDEEDMWY